MSRLPNRLPPDYHVHTRRCGHATGEPADYLEAALARNLPGLGIADHLPLLHTDEPDPSLAMAMDELPVYIEEVQALKRRRAGYLLLGIEADYRPDCVEETRSLLDAHPFDYVIGSVHYLDEWGFDDPRYVDGFAAREIDTIYREYIRLVGDAAETGMFDILGHLDLVKKFGHRADTDLSDEWTYLARRLRAAGVAVEINTAGARKPVGEMYPSAELLRILARHDVPVTFGSDAHSPSDVGRDFEEATALARACGHRTYATLTQRERPARGQPRRAHRSPVPLEAPDTSGNASEDASRDAS